MASSALRFLSAYVCMRRSRNSADADGPPVPNPAGPMAPVSLTLIFMIAGCAGSPASAASKNFFARLFTAAGPVKRSYRNTGRSGTASSSSASVGWRCSAHWFGCQPPIDVIHCPSGTPLRRSASASCTSLIDVVFSRIVWKPGRFARLTL